MENMASLETSRIEIVDTICRKGSKMGLLGQKTQDGDISMEE